MANPGDVNLCFSGDVMLGRGIDQILPYPCDPVLYESSVKSAAFYVALAERANGPIPRSVDFKYVWGEALVELERRRPDLWVVNLETAITTASDWEAKGINYRMNPLNAAVLTAAGVDCCSLANNHVLDWGEEGLRDTLETLDRASIAAAGAGLHCAQAAAPATLQVPGGRVLVFAFGAFSSGIPARWAATDVRPGVNFLPDLSDSAVDLIADRVCAESRPNDIVVASVHWGPNWSYAVPREQISFAHGLIDRAGVDIVFGHSSHHPKALEVYRGKLILYGCGDFIDDYEGIRGKESFRDDLVLMYFATLQQANGALAGLTLIPLQIRNFRLNRTTRADAAWLSNVLNRESAGFGTHLDLGADNSMTLTLGSRSG
jgi:poly-gamma-glutamate capsule biosynthesis protein CapA/YwtB (metallophosphatase superfamily)